MKGKRWRNHHRGGPRIKHGYRPPGWSEPARDEEARDATPRGRARRGAGRLTRASQSGGGEREEFPSLSYGYGWPSGFRY